MASDEQQMFEDREGDWVDNLLEDPNDQWITEGWWNPWAAMVFACVAVAWLLIWGMR